MPKPKQGIFLICEIWSIFISRIFFQLCLKHFFPFKGVGFFLKNIILGYLDFYAIAFLWTIFFITVLSQSSFPHLLVAFLMFIFHPYQLTFFSGISMVIYYLQNRFLFLRLYSVSLKLCPISTSFYSSQPCIWALMFPSKASSNIMSVILFLLLSLCVVVM